MKPGIRCEQERALSLPAHSGGLPVLVPRQLPVLVHSTTGEALYEQLITTTAQWHGLDPALVKAVIKCESGFDPWAQSPKGAQGLMQLMPSTQTMLGVSNPFNPQHNVEAGARYLAMLKQTFSGNVQLALAAYNAGPQAVVAAGYTVPAIAETQQYVRCVFAAYEQYRQPGAAPFLPDLRPLQPGTRTLAPSRRSLTPSVEARQTLIVSPLRLSSQVAQVGQRLTVELEATNTSKRPGHGIVMLNYPEHLVSFMALHTTGQAPRCSSHRPRGHQPRLRRQPPRINSCGVIGRSGPQGAPDGDYLPRAAPTPRHDTARERGPR